MKDILIKLRQENRYSQSLLSKVLGISRQAYIKYESGEVEPSVEIVRKLSKIYKVPYSVLIDNDLRYLQKSKPYVIPEETYLSVADSGASYSSGEKSQNSQEKKLYDFSEDSLSEVASPAVSYGMNNVNSQSTIQYFQNQLENLQEVIMEMKNKLTNFVLPKSDSSVAEKSPSYSKSRSFNKEEFFKLVGKINLDSSSVTELREKSLT
ncbi:MAG: helix-turn-helix domain-containing protein [Treponemataceae bacterium]|nr:helix-turn-helix domain-containing protein [Treponemataceae bacterium]